VQWSGDLVERDAVEMPVDPILEYDVVVGVMSLVIRQLGDRPTAQTRGEAHALAV
jgi:hypothetical protein